MNRLSILSGTSHTNRRRLMTRGLSILTVVLSVAVLTMTTAPVTATPKPKPGTGSFRRIATFPVFLNTCAGEDAGCVDEETVAEIVTVSSDARTLIYTDSETENIGFVDIGDPSDPQPAGLVDVGGEPTSVSVAKDYALVAVNTSTSFTDPSGHLAIVHIPTQSIVRIVDLGGQPDSVAVSHNNRFAAIAIENERDEDLGDGRPPQDPAGYLVIVDLNGEPSGWAMRSVSLLGLSQRFPLDPEPEFVDISRNNIAVVTLQENNHIVLVHLPTGRILNHFSAGSTNLSEIDVVENELIELDGMQLDRLREPDGVAWISNTEFVTADEGDLDGGSRGFTLFRVDGAVLAEAGNSVEHLVTRVGHYPEERSENKGNEPEGAEYGKYGSERFLFVGSERSSVVFVYRIGQTGDLEFAQVLPAGVGPEGLLAIPKRNLFVAASENDARGDKFRSTLTIYEFQEDGPSYPTIYSADRIDGLPIPWGALSGLAGSRNDPNLCFSIYDSFYRESRIFAVDVSMKPALITEEIILTDNGNTVDLDPEGITARQSGGFWIVSEGSGSVDDPARPVESPNLLLKVDDDGTILETVPLPDEVDDLQRRFGFEGVASVGSGDDELVYVAFQREWVDDPDDRVRIGRYDVGLEEWTFFYYPLDLPTSPNGGWVGLSEIVALNDETFAVIERDNQAGTDARIKKIYKFSVAGLTPEPQGGVFPELDKVFVRDLIPDLTADNGPVIEKVEGLGILADGTTVVVTDNDGVDDSSGETQFLFLENVFD